MQNTILMMTPTSVKYVQRGIIVKEVPQCLVVQLKKCVLIFQQVMMEVPQLMIVLHYLVIKKMDLQIHL